MTIADGFSFALGRWLGEATIVAAPYAILLGLLAVLILVEARNK